MSAKTAHLEPIRRLPVSFREFAELLRFRPNHSGRLLEKRIVLSIGSAQLDLQHKGPNNPQSGLRFTKSQFEQLVEALPHSCYNPCNSPPEDSQFGDGVYPNGFEVWA